jgi:hypothetical protein
MPPFWKEPRQSAVEERRAREAVRRSDARRCRVCYRRSASVHEEKRRGAGGRVTLANSFVACEVSDGGGCHPLLQARLIRAVMADGSEEFNARGSLEFEMTKAIANRVFPGGVCPAHVRIVEGE